MGIHHSSISLPMPSQSFPCCHEEASCSATSRRRCDHPSCYNFGCGVKTCMRWTQFNIKMGQPLVVRAAAHTTSRCQYTTAHTKRHQLSEFGSCAAASAAMGDKGGQDPEFFGKHISWKSWKVFPAFLYL